jgi:hypothetical protein
MPKSKYKVIKFYANKDGKFIHLYELRLRDRYREHVFIAQGIDKASAFNNMEIYARDNGYNKNNIEDFDKLFVVENVKPAATWYCVHLRKSLFE